MHNRRWFWVVGLIVFIAIAGVLNATSGNRSAQSGTSPVASNTDPATDSQLQLAADGGDSEERPDLDVPYVPTPQEVVDRMLQLVAVKKTDTLYDLGCGDGRLVVTAAQKFGARGVGVDLDPQRIRESNENAQKAKVTDRVKFHQGDLFKMNVSPATAMTLYLLPSVNLKLRPKLFRELKPGTRIVSHDFTMGDWRADRTVQVDGPYRQHTLYYWMLPAHVAGEWDVQIPGRDEKTTFSLRQKFQDATGTATSGGQTVPLQKVKLEGDRLTFAVAERKGGPARWSFDGRVSGGTMKGSVVPLDQTGSGKQNWTAKRIKSVPMDEAKDSNEE